MVGTLLIDFLTMDVGVKLDFLDDFPDLEKDASNEWEIPLEKNKLRIVKKEPYSFWGFSYERGPIPKELEGVWTSPSDAKKAALYYLKSKKYKGHECLELRTQL